MNRISFDGRCFSSLFSMAKIKDVSNVPESLQALMARVPYGEDNEGWFWDSVGKKYAFFTTTDDNEDHYFVFEREQHKSMAESPQGSAYRFVKLIVVRDGIWYSGVFSQNDLERVVDIFMRSKNSLIDILGLKGINPVRGLYVVIC